MARFAQKKRKLLLSDTGIVRNQQKIEAAIQSCSEINMEATLLFEVDLPLLTNNLLDSFVFLLQSLTGEKENGAVLNLYLVGIPRLALYNSSLLALVSPVSDKDLFSYGKVDHKIPPWCGLLVVWSA